jgi:DNA-binding CsgD family transcriptional regulator
LVRSLFQRVSGVPGPRSRREPGAGEGEADERVSARERQILALLVQGLSNKEIAKELGLSPNTIRNHLQRLQERLHARNRVQLALLARDCGYG